MPISPQWNFLRAATRSLKKHNANAQNIAEVRDSVAEELLQEFLVPFEGSDSLQQELESLSQLTREETLSLVSQLVQSEGIAPALQEHLAQYLVQIPYAARRSVQLSRVGGRLVQSSQNKQLVLSVLPEKMPRFKPGDRPLANGDFELVEQLGEGGFGEVWKAVNPNMPSREPVVLKFCADPSKAATLRNEAKLLDYIESARQKEQLGIVRLINTNLNAETPFLVYEYINGGTLRDYIASRSATSIDAREARAIIQSLAESLAYPHSLQPPIVHRDLKPDNILLQKTANQTVYKIADFGIGLIANQTTSSSRSNVGPNSLAMIQGSHTPLYASPQQRGGNDPSTQDDIYAIGVIWYQLLTGDLERGAPSGVVWQKKLQERGVSDDELRLLAECLEVDVADRILNAAVLAERLRVLAQDTVIVEVDEIVATDHEVEPLHDETLPPQNQTTSITNIVLTTKNDVSVRPTQNVTRTSQHIHGTWLGLTVLLCLSAIAVGAWMFYRTPAPVWKIQKNALRLLVFFPKQRPSAEEQEQLARECSEGNITACQNEAVSAWQSPADAKRLVLKFSQYCQRGNKTSCYHWGLALQETETVASEKPQEIFETLCQEKLEEACYALAQLLQKQQKHEPAETMLRDSCTRGYLRSCSGLGDFYLSGREGVEANPSKAFPLFLHACENGDMQGCGLLGYLYLSGQGVERRNPEEAFSRLQRSCEEGFILACRHLADMYAQGDGVSKDERRAYAMYERSCEYREAAACFAVATMYEYGEIVAKSKELAQERYEQGCTYGSSQSCIRLADILQETVGEDAANLSRAKALYEKACERDTVQGCLRLADFLFAGRGTTKNVEKAFTLYTQSCANGLPEACRWLGDKYQAGEGVTKDIQKAQVYYRSACDSGDFYACQSIR